MQMLRIAKRHEKYEQYSEFEVPRSRVLAYVDGHHVRRFLALNISAQTARKIESRRASVQISRR